MYFYPRSPCGERLQPQELVRRNAEISIHALLAESDPAPPLYQRYELDFYPRSPCGERPREVESMRTLKKISIHALLAESDMPRLTSSDSFALFLSTLSLRRATMPKLGTLGGFSISIHALLAESDSRIKANIAAYNHFYPRSPCGERLSSFSAFASAPVFLSTLSLRRATILQFPPITYQ